jgi:hypothetical protein
MKILKLVLLMVLTVIACGGILKLSHPANIDTIGRDFAAYWTSGYLLLNGDNPYSSEKILTVQKSLGWTENKPLVIYNPPWVLTFLIPFCMSDFTTNKIIWLICMLSLMMFSADRLWLIYGGSRQSRIWALLVMVTFIPGLLAYKIGQIVPLMLIGLVGFLYFAKKEQWWLAGMMTVFIAVKPHTIYLFWFALLLLAVKQRRWPVLLGSALTLLCAALLPLFYNLNIYNQYFNNIVTKSYASYWATPSIGTFLRFYFGSEYNWLQYIPILPGLIWFILHWHKYRNMWIWENQISPLILVSLMTIFYTWPTDYLMLLPAVILSAVEIYQMPEIRYLFSILVIYIMINTFALVSTYFLDFHWFIWMPYALWINRVFAKKQLDLLRHPALR